MERILLEMKAGNRLIFKYILQSAAGMLGISVYILADTFFIAKHSGTVGLTVLNLALPIYGLIYAIGSMIGIGSATKYAIGKAMGERDVDFYFIQSLMWSVMISIPFVLLGIFAPKQILQFMGADQMIADFGMSYLRIVLLGTPFFMMNYTFTAFTRNDNAPTTAMFGSLIGSLFNILFDYIFMFPMRLGLTGAALATALCPIVTMSVCCTHYFGKQNGVGFQWKIPSIGHLFSCCQFGVSAFVGEITSAVTTTIFNTLILEIAGNTGIAAYGVIANISLVAVSILNGISQGIQPLISNSYGEGRTKDVKKLLKTGIIVAILVQIIIISSVWGFTDELICFFNSEGNETLFSYAYSGMRCYFLGYLFAGMNIIFAGYFSAVGRTKQAFTVSILRGALAIAVCAIVMSKYWGMNGVWLSFLASEIITFTVVLLMKCRRFIFI